MKNTKIAPLCKIQDNARLSSFTTFQLGGPCRGLITCQTPEQLQQSVLNMINQNHPFILIGGGSNIVVSDKGLNCYVIRYLTDIPIIEHHGNELIVSGSTKLDTLAEHAAEAGLEGLNYTSGIPGTVGGAIAGNAGAFGQQIGDVVTSADLISLHGKNNTVPGSSLQFSYRHSCLKETNDIVSSVCLNLKSGHKKTLQKERIDILKLRHEKHPDLFTQPCAGSFFRNIEPSSKAEKRQAAGWFLEQTGVKTFACGGAKIFEKHANIIIKNDNGTAQNVFDLSQKMAQAVRNQFNIDLIREVRFAGPFDNMPPNIHNILW